LLIRSRCRHGFLRYRDPLPAGMSSSENETRRLPSAIHDIAVRQDEVLSRKQLRDVDISDKQVSSRARSGLWRTIGSDVVVLHSGRLSRRQKWWAGVLHVRDPAILCLASAAEAGGLRGFEQADVHVATQHGRECEDLEDSLITVRVHQTRHVSADVVPLRDPSRQSLARAVLEMASDAENDNRTRALIAAVVQQRLVRPDQMRSFVDVRPTLPKRALIRETIIDVEAGSHSLPELDYARALRRSGLPQPAQQQRICRANGSWYLDNDFEQWQVTVEVNGIQHYELLANEYDDMRRASLQVEGRIVVDISSYSVRHRVGMAMLITAEALLARGWLPSPRAKKMLARYAAAESWAGFCLDRPA
jgi:hypothetical protein